MKKRISYWLLGVIILAIVGSIIWKNHNSNSIPETIRIGAILPLTGPVAFMGEGTLNGLLLAKEHANTGEWGKMPYTFEILAEDGGGIPKTSVSAYQKLVSTQGVRTIVSTLSGVCMTLLPLTERDSVLFFANASHPQLKSKTHMMFRHSNSADQEAKVIIAAITENVESAGITIVAQNDDYGSAFISSLSEQIKSNGIKLLASVTYDKQDFDARLIAQSSLKKNPEVLVLVGAGKDLGLLIRRVRELGYKGNIFSSLGFVLVPGAVEAAGEYAEGVRFTRFIFDETNIEYIKLATDYKKRFGKEIGAESIIAYNTMYLYAKAVQKSQSSAPNIIAKTISVSRDFQAPGEKLTITSDGGILPDLRVETYSRKSTN